MTQLEESISNEESDKKIALSKKSRKELENADYNTPDYKLFCFNILGESVQKKKDDIKLLKSISNSEMNWHS